MASQTTDSEGKTSFSNILDGDYDLSVSKTGYAIDTSIVVVNGADVDKIVSLVSSVTGSVFVWDASIDSNFSVVNVSIGVGGGIVDYGDGTVESLEEGEEIILDHDYTDSEVYNVTVSNLTSLGEYSLTCRTGLISVNLEATSLGDGCFDGCDTLVSVSLPNATSLGDSCFSNCYSLNSISLPLITDLGNNNFNSITTLSSVELPSATTLGEYCFEGCTGLSSVSLPSATSLGYSCFDGCTGLSSVSLPSATSLGKYCFEGCTGLTSVELPSATTLTGTFKGCTGLTSVELPSATSLGDKCFYKCTNLNSVKFGTTTPPTLGNNCFMNVPTTCIIYCPTGSKSDYETALSNKGYSFTVTEY